MNIVDKIDWSLLGSMSLLVHRKFLRVIKLPLFRFDTKYDYLICDIFNSKWIRFNWIRIDSDA